MVLGLVVPVEVVALPLMPLEEELLSMLLPVSAAISENPMPSSATTANRLANVVVLRISYLL